MKPLNQKPPLSQKKPLIGLIGRISPEKHEKHKDVTFRHIPRNPQIFDSDTVTIKQRLEMKEMYGNYDFVSNLPVKPKSQPHSYPSHPEQQVFEANTGSAQNKFNFRDSIKRSSTIVVSPVKRGKADKVESDKGDKQRKIVNQHSIFVDTAQQALAGKMKNKDISPTQKEMEHRYQAARDKSPYSRQQAINGSHVRQKALPRVETSPKKTRPELSELMKDDSMGKKDLKQSNMASSLQKNKIILPKMPQIASVPHKNASPRNHHLVEPKKFVLIVLDHDLGFLREHLLSLKTAWNVSFERVENIGTDIENEDYAKKYSLDSYQAIFVFIKFSPRVKRQSLKVLQALARSEKCFVVKCVLDVESVDLQLDYENSAITMEKKKQIEHVLFLERESFDSYSISSETMGMLEGFVSGKIKGSPKLMKY